ncbi:hypothetical protein BST61_g10427 [Cercospora zeina]
MGVDHLPDQKPNHSSISTTNRKTPAQHKHKTIHNLPPSMRSFTNIATALAFAAAGVSAAPSAQAPPDSTRSGSQTPPANVWVLSQTSADCKLGGDKPCEYSFHADSAGSTSWPPFSATCSRSQITGHESEWWPCTLQAVDNANDYPQYQNLRVYSWLNFDTGYNGNAHVLVAASFDVTNSGVSTYEAGQQFTYSNWEFPHVDSFNVVPQPLVGN